MRELFLPGINIFIAMKTWTDVCNKTLPVILVYTLRTFHLTSFQFLPVKLAGLHLLRDWLVADTALTPVRREMTSGLTILRNGR